MTITARDLHVTIVQAAKLIGVRRETAWRYAKSGRLGPIRVVDRRGRMEISVAELAKRYSVNVETARQLGITN